MSDTVKPRPGVYTAVWSDGTRRMVAIVLGPNGQPAMIPVDDRSIVLEIVENNWSGVDRLIPLYRQGGLSGAMYWDHDDAIDMTDG